MGLLDKLLGRGKATADKVGLDDTAEKTGEVAGDAAGKAGDVASGAADETKDVLDG